MGAPVAQVAARYLRRSTRSLLQVQAASFARPVPAAAVDSALAMVKPCHVFVAGRGASAARITLLSVTRLAMGDGGVILRMLVAVGRVSIRSEVVLVRLGHTLVGATYSGPSASADVAQAAVAQVLATLPH